MQAGVAAADITPEPGLVLQGHIGAPPSHRVLYPLEVRAIVFRQDDVAAAVVTLDVIGVTRDTTAAIRRQIEQRCGIPMAHVMVVASHTHCAPATLPCLGLVPDESFMRTLVDRAVACVVDASENVHGVTIGHGCGSAHFNVNRRPLPGTTEMFPNEAGIVDRRARVLRVNRSTDDAPLAVLFHYSCHPTARKGTDGEISPDYPGVARTIIERELGCRALFLPGCCGNVRPRNFASATKEQLDDVGLQLARAVRIAAMFAKTVSSDSITCREIDIALPERTTMQLFQIGAHNLVTLPGEPVQEIGHEIERRLHEREVWPVGYANDMVGYLVTERMKREGGYEPTAYPYFNRPAPFENEETVLVEGAERLARAREHE